MSASNYDKEALRAFLVESNKAGYAGGDARRWIKEPDGSMTIQLEQGPWKLHDNFFGGEPYAGRTVILHQGKPVWMLVYYGWVVEEGDPEQIYGVLRKALMRMPEDHPFRGPERHEEGEFVYTNRWSGGLERFVGEEQIIQEERLLYRANYTGGWVDKRQGV